MRAMALYLTEDEVRDLLPMEACVGAVEAAFLHWGEGRATNHPRARVAMGGSMLHLLAASSEPLGRMAAKVYATSPRGACFVVLLFDAATSELLAILEADRLGQMRTGAASGIATRRLARPDAQILGVLGSGWQARSQVEAIATTRRLRAWARDRGRLIDFCAEVVKLTGVPVRPAVSAEAAVRDADIIVTATSSREPVLRGSWLSPGTHLNAIGSNRADRREIDADAVQRSELIVVDSREQARLEAGDLVLASGRPGQPAPLDRAVELVEIVAGRHPGRQGARQITLFKSLGIGLEDLAAASAVYDRAIAAGAGRSRP
jgi:ornithine cyclodeaminase/alanine dehydrogenase-like protein (mu-crystallin family)